MNKRQEIIIILLLSSVIVQIPNHTQSAVSTLGNTIIQENGPQTLYSGSNRVTGIIRMGLNSPTGNSTVITTPDEQYIIKFQEVFESFGLKVHVGG